MGVAQRYVCMAETLLGADVANIVRTVVYDTRLPEIPEDVCCDILDVYSVDRFYFVYDGLAYYCVG